MKKPFFAAAALVVGAALALAGCGSSDTSDTSDITEGAVITQEDLAGTWVLTGVSGSEGVVEDLPEGSLTIEPDGAFGFDAQCNQFAGVMTVEDGVVVTGSASETIQTLMLCDGAVGQVDNIASGVFANVQSATLALPEGSPETLTLVGEDGASLDFARQ